MIYIYTDGSFIRINPNEKQGYGYGGWAYCHINGDEIVHKQSGGESGNTFANGKMELVAVYQALQYANNLSAIIYCDSEYIVKGFNDWRESWERTNFKKGKIKFNNIWQQAFTLYDPTLHVIKWVRSHQGTFGNEMADQLANQAARNQMELAP